MGAAKNLSHFKREKVWGVVESNPEVPFLPNWSLNWCQFNVAGYGLKMVYKNIPWMTGGGGGGGDSA